MNNAGACFLAFHLFPLFLQLVLNGDNWKTHPRLEAETPSWQWEALAAGGWLTHGAGCTEFQANEATRHTGLKGVVLVYLPTPRGHCNTQKPGG